MKDKTQHSVAAALKEHFLRQRPVDTNIPGTDFFIERTILRSDRGTDFINAAVNDLCKRLGCIVEYSCPGQLSKYQNSLAERRIKEIGRIARSLKEMSGVPDLASAYCALQSVDIEWCNRCDGFLATHDVLWQSIIYG